MYNKLNSWMAGSLLVFAAMVCASSAYAGNKDFLIYGNAYGIIPADYPGNPYELEIKVELPQGVVSTTVDGSMDPAHLKDREQGADKIYIGGNLIATVPHESVCLSVEGNIAILWHVFTENVDGFCKPGELGLEMFDSENNTVTAINATVTYGIDLDPENPNRLTGCSQADANLLQGVPPFQGGGHFDVIDGA